MALFTVWDYLVVIVVLMISTSIGLYYRLIDGRQATKTEYLLANSSMSSIPVAFSLMATFFSAISLMGNTQESYQFGIPFMYTSLGCIVCMPIVVYLFLPVFYKIRATSVYTYLERRFGYPTRLFASVTFSVQILLYTGVALYAPAMALVVVTGIAKIPAILGIGLVCTFYSTLGGMKAVLIADVFQSLLMIAAICSVMISSILKGHGIGEIWREAQASGRVTWPSLSMDPTIRHSFWSLFLGGAVTFLSLVGVNQLQVQRLMAVRSLKSAQKALWWSLLLYCIVLSLTLFGGLTLFNFYSHCDPVLEGRISVREQLLPLYVIDTMSEYPGLPGLFVSGIFAASLATVSSAISGLAAVTLEDYITIFQEKVLRKTSKIESSFLPKILAGVFGIAGMLLAIFADSVNGILEVSQIIFGVGGGPLLGLFVIGMFTTRANEGGVLIGAVVGVVLDLWIGFGGPKPPAVMLPFSSVGCEVYNTTDSSSNAPSDEVEHFYLFKISYLWLSVLGFLSTTTIGYACSVFLEKINLSQNRPQMDFDLLVPPISAHLKRKAFQNDVKDASEIESCL